MAIRDGKVVTIRTARKRSRLGKMRIFNLVKPAFVD